ncbi:hypothetical protein JKF63_00633 [Porcisia hertigi]|uniref:Calcineurin-like phosphoesterase domain-containing protein n=1 Tax=Porcisia hertigi TaxID=2761500 RepID=A0A836I9X4_9TRYP|nr:hypothetical protein JKF63_00633 [Porcisia hertigi]
MISSRSVKKFMAYAVPLRYVKSGLFFWTVLVLVLAGTSVISNIPLGLYTPTVGFQQKKHRIPPVGILPPRLVSPAGKGVVGALKQHIIAIGDINGDIARLRSILRAAHVLEKGVDAWRQGCNDIVVQLGNVVDSGPDAPQILLFLSKLKAQAVKSGGRLITLSGDRELLALSGVSKFMHPQVLKLSAGEEGFRHLYSPRGRYGRIVAEENLAVAIVSDIVFVHGGLTAAYARHGVASLNSKWYEGTLKPNLTTHPFHDAESPLSDHSVVQAAMRGDCDPLFASLAALKARERVEVNVMVVGHTTMPDGKVGTWCDGKLVSIDVAMSRHVKNGSNEAYVCFEPKIRKNKIARTTHPRARFHIHYPLGRGKRTTSIKS